MTGTAAASVANADQCVSVKPAESAVSSDATADEEEPPSPIAKKPRKRETPSNDDVEQQRILEYRRQVKAKLRERMQVVINELEGRFKVCCPKSSPCCFRCVTLCLRSTFVFRECNWTLVAASNSHCHGNT